MKDRLVPSHRLPTFPFDADENTSPPPLLPLHPPTFRTSPFLDRLMDLRSCLGWGLSASSPRVGGDRAGRDGLIPGISRTPLIPETGRHGCGGGTGPDRSFWTPARSFPPGRDTGEWPPAPGLGGLKGHLQSPGRRPYPSQTPASAQGRLGTAEAAPLPVRPTLALRPRRLPPKPRHRNRGQSEGSEASPAIVVLVGYPMSPNLFEPQCPSWDPLRPQSQRVGRGRHKRLRPLLADAGGSPTRRPGARDARAHHPRQGRGGGGPGRGRGRGRRGRRRRRGAGEAAQVPPPGPGDPNAGVEESPSGPGPAGGPAAGGLGAGAGPSARGEAPSRRRARNGLRPERPPAQEARPGAQPGAPRPLGTPDGRSARRAASSALARPRDPDGDLRPPPVVPGTALGAAPTGDAGRSA